MKIVLVFVSLIGFFHLDPGVAEPMECAQTLMRMDRAMSFFEKNAVLTEGSLPVWNDLGLAIAETVVISGRPESEVVDFFKANLKPVSGEVPGYDERELSIAETSVMTRLSSRTIRARYEGYTKGTSLSRSPDPLEISILKSAYLAGLPVEVVRDRFASLIGAVSGFNEKYDPREIAILKSAFLTYRSVADVRMTFDEILQSTSHPSEMDSYELAVVSAALRNYIY